MLQGSGVADTIRSGITNLAFFTDRPDILAYGETRICQAVPYNSGVTQTVLTLGVTQHCQSDLLVQRSGPQPVPDLGSYCYTAHQMQLET